LIARNLMLAHHWGIKTFYYSLINKQGAKSRAEDAELPFRIQTETLAEDDCEACKL